jgi:ATP-binding cassette subfamily C (CFTR/MRP) protein 1
MTAIGSFEEIQTLITSFNRIQEYLLSKERIDTRIIPSIIGKTVKIPRSLSNDEGVELKDLSSPLKKATSDDSVVAIAVQSATAGYSPGNLVLNDITFQIFHGKTTMILGPVGSGKSTLLKLLLGEIPETSGSVLTTFSKSAFCPQSPWITWGTIQSNILGMSKWDQSWYNTVVRACALSADFQELPDGDQTKTGTRGSRLSGGQQKRIVSSKGFVRKWLKLTLCSR